MTQDPVCGMDVQPEQAAGQQRIPGSDILLCCPVCKEKFDKDPQHYAQPDRRRRASVDDGSSRASQEAYHVGRAFQPDNRPPRFGEPDLLTCPRNSFA